MNGETCDCAACTLAGHMREALASGLPPEYLVPMTLEALVVVSSEFGVDVEVFQDTREGTVH